MDRGRRGGRSHPQHTLFRVPAAQGPGGRSECGLLLHRALRVPQSRWCVHILCRHPLCELSRVRLRGRLPRHAHGGGQPRIRGSDHRSDSQHMVGPQYAERDWRYLQPANHAAQRLPGTNRVVEPAGRMRHRARVKRMVGIPGGGTTNLGLAAAVYNGKLFLFGVSAFAGGVGSEFVNVFDGAQWSGWSALPGAGTTNTGLAATVFNGKLYLFGVGAFPGGGAGGEFVNVFDGAHWSGWSPVAGGGTTNTGLAAAVHKNKLCLFGVGAFHGAGSAGEFLNSFDGAKSSGWSAVPDAGSTNVSLSSAESGGRLYVFGVSAFQGGAGGEFVNTMD